jgi:putative effector of murein hydrolase
MSRQLDSTLQEIIGTVTTGSSTGLVVRDFFRLHLHFDIFIYSNTYISLVALFWTQPSVMCVGERIGGGHPITLVV